MRVATVHGLSGTLIGPRAAADWMSSLEPGVLSLGAASIAHWAARAASALGPSASERRLLEEIENLLARGLGFSCSQRAEYSVATTPGGDTVVLASTAWGRSLSPAPRRVQRACIDAGADWAIVFNGMALAVVDARAGAPRRVAILSLAHLAARMESAMLAGALLDAGAVDRHVLADAVRASDASSGELRGGLRDGVNRSLDALTGPLAFDAAIAVLFRMLFVLFAEARALVPVWHAVYRQHYAIGSLAERVSGDGRGMWAALEAGRRLLGEGCDAGSLRIAPFNGRLFARSGPRRWAASPALDSALDRPAADALAALVSYTPAKGGARRVHYAELDVEELGSIYERVLDLDPAAEGRARKESGSFYTPRALTAFVVRRTLAPLVHGASSDSILALRVVDPAMGSGAFLVAALHYLAGALERALVDEGALPDGDVRDADRQELRRLVAQRCLFGVDANPTAVMLAKLSVWLATLAGGKPLSFLDHRLKTGNSLAGIDPATALRPPSRARRDGPLPLFDSDAYRAAAREDAADAAEMGGLSENTLEQVRAKERAHRALTGGAAALARWRTLADAWCAWWFLPAARRADAREFGGLVDAVIHRSRRVPGRIIERRLREAAGIQTSLRFFHWPVEFPEVFPAGFDAVIGNPPWEMLRAEAGSADRSALKDFVRHAGVYSLATGGHLNLYQLFVERALQIVRAGGRIGMILPWGLMSDEGSAPLRRRLVDQAQIDTLVRFDNSRGIFQAHRSLRFAAVTASAGASTMTLDLTRAPGTDALDDIPDAGAAGASVAITRDALETLGGPSLRVPDVGDSKRLAVALRIAGAHRALGDPAGWGAAFGRELNLTDDRAQFSRAGLPVLEGKHIRPFHADAGSVRHRIRREAAARLLPARPFDRARLAYRDVTALTNHQTLIAAIVPAGCVTGHSLFCLRNAWDAATQRALCVILNSVVANFLIRLFVSAHVTTALMSWLPVPDRLQATAALGHIRVSRTPRAELDAIVAHLYGLSPSEVEALAPAV